MDSSDNSETPWRWLQVITQALAGLATLVAAVTALVNALHGQAS